MDDTKLKYFEESGSQLMRGEKVRVSEATDSSTQDLDLGSGSCGVQVQGGSFQYLESKERNCDHCTTEEFKDEEHSLIGRGDFEIIWSRRRDLFGGQVPFSL